MIKNILSNLKFAKVHKSFTPTQFITCFLIHLMLFLCGMNVCMHACVYNYFVCMWYSWNPEESIISLEQRVTSDC